MERPRNGEGLEPAGLEGGLKAARDAFLSQAAAARERSSSALERFAHRFSVQLEDLSRRLKEAGDRSESGARRLEIRLKGGAFSEDDLRARLAILDMEYASRARLAEEGLRVLEEDFRRHLEGERRRLEGLLEDLLETADAALESAAPGWKAPPLAPGGRPGPELERLLRESERTVSELRGELASARAAAEEAERLRRSVEDLEDWLGKAKEGESRARAEAQRLGRELEQAREESRKAREEGAPKGLPEQMRKRLDSIREELDGLRRRLREVGSERDGARLEAERLRGELKRLQERASGSSSPGIEELKRDYEERLANAAGQINTLRIMLDEKEKGWEDTTSRQDARRLQEIFLLRAQIQELKWRLGEKGGGSPGDPMGPGDGGKRKGPAAGKPPPPQEPPA